MDTALKTLQAALQAEGLDAYITSGAVETFRDWSYASGTDRTTDWYNPADDYIEAYSDTIRITFTGSAFVAEESGKAIAREEIVAEYDPEAGITAQDIENAAYSIADTVADLLPKRDIAAEREEAYVEYMLEQVA